MIELMSWACQTCGYGDWGENMPVRCATCKSTLVKTGTVLSIPLNP